MSAAPVEMCRSGHPRTPENIRERRGARECIECARQRRERRKERMAGDPCKGCGRRNVTLDLGRTCGRCRRRTKAGIPLDAPRRHGGGKPPKAEGEVLPPQRPSKDSKLPKGWFDTAPPKPAARRSQVSSLTKDFADVGPIPVIPEEVSVRCLRLLERHGVEDLAGMLGVREDAAQPAPAPAVTSKPAANVTGVWRRAAADLIAEVEALLEAGVAGAQIVRQLGYSRRDSLIRRLDRRGRHDLARRLGAIGDHRRGLAS